MEKQDAGDGDIRISHDEGLEEMEFEIIKKNQNYLHHKNSAHTMIKKIFSKFQKYPSQFGNHP